MANHEPLLGQLVPGGFVVVVEEGGNRRSLAVQGGFLSVTGESVTILAESAQWSDGIDAAAERAAMEVAEPGTDEYNRAHSRLVAVEHAAK